MADAVEAIEPDWLASGGSSSRLHAPGWAQFMVLIYAGFWFWAVLVVLGMSRSLAQTLLAEPPDQGKPGKKKRKARTDGIWRTLRHWSRVLLFEGSEISKFWPLLRCFLSIAVCIVYVFETYWTRIGWPDYIFRAIVGVAFLVRHLGRFVMSDAPCTFVFSIECLIECLSITSLLLAHGRLWLNFSFLQAFIALSRLEALEKNGLLLAQNATIGRLVVRLILQAVVFVYIVASGLQMFELLGEAPFFKSASLFELSWVNAFYFVVITITTVGYGDFVPYTMLGRFCTIVVIISGVFLVSSGVNEAIEVVSHLHRGQGVFSKPAGEEHVIVTGNIKWAYLKHFVIEFYAEQRNADTKVVVLCDRPAWSDDDWNNFVGGHTNIRKLIVELHGSADELKDLLRCQLENASGVFVLCNPHESDPYKEDSETLQNILAIRNFNPSVPIYSICSLRDSLFQVTFASQEANIEEESECIDNRRILSGLDNQQLFSSIYSDERENEHIEEEPDSGLDCPRRSRAVCMQNIEVALFADNVFCNGLSTLLSNLVFRAVPTTNRNDRPWLTEYKFGAEYHMERAEIPIGLVGKRCSDIALMLYDCQLLLIATHSRERSKWKVVQPDTIFASGMDGIFITLLEKADLSFALGDISLRLLSRSDDAVGVQGETSFLCHAAPLPDALFGDGQEGNFDSGRESSLEDSGSESNDDLDESSPKDPPQPQSSHIYRSEASSDASNDEQQEFGQTRDPSAAAVPSVGLSEVVVIAKQDSKPPRFVPSVDTGVEPNPFPKATRAHQRPLENPMAPSGVSESDDPPLQMHPGSGAGSPEDQRSSSSSLEKSNGADSVRILNNPTQSNLQCDIGQSVAPSALRNRFSSTLKDDISNDKRAGSSAPPRRWSGSSKDDASSGERCAPVKKGTRKVGMPDRSRSMADGSRLRADKSSQDLSHVAVLYHTRDLPVHLSRHVVVCIIGEMSLRNMEFLLERIWSSRPGHAVRCPVVAIHPDFPGSYEESFSKYRGSLFLLNGSGTSISTLQRAQFEQALAIMVMACEDKVDVESADSRAIFTVMTLDHLLGENASTFVCCTLDAEESLELLRAPARPRRQNVQLGGGFHPVIIRKGEDTVLAKQKKYDRIRPLTSGGRRTVAQGHSWREVLLKQKAHDGVEDRRFFGRKRFVGTRGDQYGSLAGIALTSHSREEIFERQRFASGEMMISSLYTALLIRDFVDPGILDLIQEMTGMRLGKKNRKKSGSWIRLLSIPATVMRTDGVEDNTELTYRALVEELIKLGCVPLGLYRSGNCPVRMQVDVSDEHAATDETSRGSRSSLVSSSGMRTRTASFSSFSGVNSSTPISASGGRPWGGNQAPHHRRQGSGLGSLSGIPGVIHHERNPSGASMVLDSKMRDMLRAEGRLTEREYYCPTTEMVVKFEETRAGENVLPYVFTNPEPYTLVSEADGVFVLSNPRQELPQEWN